MCSGLPGYPVGFRTLFIFGRLPRFLTITGRVPEFLIISGRVPDLIITGRLPLLCLGKRTYYCFFSGSGLLMLYMESEPRCQWCELAPFVTHETLGGRLSLSFVYSSSMSHPTWSFFDRYLGHLPDRRLLRSLRSLSAVPFFRTVFYCLTWLQTDLQLGLLLNRSVVLFWSERYCFEGSRLQNASSIDGFQDC
jgi:hypothetical protein